MTSDNKIVRSLWIGKELSKVEQLSICSFLENGHDFYLYTYNEIKNVPKGAIIKDANEIFPYDDIFLDNMGTYASFADMFRYALIYKYGGWWSDMDIICLKPLNFKQEFIFATEKFKTNKNHDYLISNCIFKSPAQSTYLLNLINYISEEKNDEIIWSSFGPKLFTGVLNQYDISSYIMLPHTFCPINWDEIQLLFTPNYQFEDNNTYTIHLWNEIWRRNKLDKNSIFHQESLIERYKRKYLFS